MKKIFGVILAIFGILTLSCQNVSAVSDLSGSYTAQINNSYTLCDGNCSDYNYLIIEPAVESFNKNYCNVGLYSTTTGNNKKESFYVNLSSKTIYELPDMSAWYGGDLSKVILTSCSGDPLSSTGVSFNYTFTEDIGSSSEPPACPTADTPPFVDVVVNSFWQYHIAFAGVVVPIIVIFFVYRLIKGRL